MEKIEQIRKLRTTIKDLSFVQHVSKRLRKTKLAPEEREKLKKSIEGRAVKSFYGLGSNGDVCLRACYITAALNIYLGLRGREYRHQVNDQTRYWVESDTREILKELETEPKKV